MKPLLLLISFLVLTACSPTEEAPEPKTDSQPTVPEDNVFHDQVAALEKAKDAAKKQEEHAQELDAAIEQATGRGDESSN